MKGLITKSARINTLSFFFIDWSNPVLCCSSCIVICDYELYDSSFIHIFYFLVFSSFSCWFVYMIAVTPFHAFFSNKLQKCNFSLIFHFAECMDEFVSM